MTQTIVSGRGRPLLAQDSAVTQYTPAACDKFLYSFKGAPRRAGPDGLDVEREKRTLPTVREMSGQSGPP